MSQFHYLDTFRTQLIGEQVYAMTSELEFIAFIHEEIIEKQRKLSDVLVLGGGSNVLFIEPFEGIILINQIKGISVDESSDSWFLHVGAGESWHEFVSYTIKNNMPGLENLAMIPGTVGAAPIQNIGAYGAELKMFCHYVDVINVDTLATERIFAESCQFGYRDSLFKRTLKDKVIITAVGFHLPKKWQPILSYGELKQLTHQDISAQEVFDKICQVRQEKLPDPSIVGNAGSFFKNPIIDISLFEKLKHRFPQIPSYPVPESHSEVKLAAGWLIDCAGLKGFAINDAKVHPNQALVLTNQGKATGKEIALLAKHVQEEVLSKFNVLLEPEVRFIGAKGEIDSLQYLGSL